MALALIALGSNVGDRAAILAAAFARLGAIRDTRLLRHSTLRATPPIGGPQGQGEFLNAAALLETTLTPRALLVELQSIENDLGRQRTVHWGARTLDLDLLLFDQLVLDEPGLALPHPAMSFRRFVLDSAAEVAPEMIHPTIGQNVGQLLQRLDATPTYLAIAGPQGCDQSQLAAALAAPGRIVVHDSATNLAADRGPGSPSPDLAERLKFEQRSATLATAMSGSATLVVSDFWLPQGLLELQALGQPVDFAILDNIPAPKLLVVLDEFSDTPDEPRKHERRRKLWQDAFAGCPQSLRCPTLHARRGVAEVEAAIEAMR